LTADDGQKGRVRRRPGRVEAALDQALLEHRNIEVAERAALRAQARAVDMGEAHADPREVSEANRVYLELRSRAGLVAAPAAAADPFEQLLADMGGSGAGSFQPPQP
jgi:hypothetical protein